MFQSFIFVYKNRNKDYHSMKTPEMDTFLLPLLRSMNVVKEKCL